MPVCLTVLTGERAMALQRKKVSNFFIELLDAFSGR